MNVFVCQNTRMQSYVDKMMPSLHSWLVKKEAERIVFVMCDAVTGERLERWQFDIKLDDDSIEEQTAKEVDMESLRKELRKTLLQIHNMYVLLPTLPDSCTPSFKLLIYVKNSVETPPRGHSGHINF